MTKVPAANSMSWQTMKLHCEKRHAEVTIITYSAHDVDHRAGNKDHEHEGTTCG
jgi:hypothetical protein